MNNYETLYERLLIKHNDLKMSSEKERKELIAKINDGLLINIGLENENTELRKIDRCACWGWQLVSAGLAVYILITLFV